MQSNFHLDAYEVDAVTQQGRPVRFYITDGCNGKYLIHTEHDQLYVDKSELIKVMQLIEMRRQEDETYVYVQQEQWCNGKEYCNPTGRRSNG